MNQQLIILPCLALMLLTVIVLIRMFLTRVQAVKSGKIGVNYFKTYDLSADAPRPMTQASRNFTNLFEVPTLFYALCAFLLITQNVDQMTYLSAWLYVLLRALHSYIHLTSNKLGPRMSVYGLSWLVLIFMGSILLFKILTTVTING